jgi:hypothetical protein
MTDCRKWRAPRLSLIPQSPSLVSRVSWVFPNHLVSLFSMHSHWRLHLAVCYTCVSPVRVPRCIVRSPERNRGINKYKFWNTANVFKYPSKYRGNHCLAMGSIGIISICCDSSVSSCLRLCFLVLCLCSFRVILYSYSGIRWRTRTHTHTPDDSHLTKSPCLNSRIHGGERGPVTRFTRSAPAFPCHL